MDDTNDLKHNKKNITCLNKKFLFAWGANTKLAEHCSSLRSGLYLLVVYKKMVGWSSTTLIKLRLAVRSKDRPEILTRLTFDRHPNKFGHPCGREVSSINRLVILMIGSFCDASHGLSKKKRRLVQKPVWCVKYEYNTLQFRISYLIWSAWHEKKPLNSLTQIW